MFRFPSSDRTSHACLALASPVAFFKFLSLRAISFSVLALLAACTSAPKPYEPTSPTSTTAAPGPLPSGAAGGTAPVAQPVTKLGDNFQPMFSPDGKRLLFISENREAHKQAQLYEVDLATMTEKRITFQDGDVFGAVYFPDGQRVLYASATDEIKEDPYFIRTLKKKYEDESLVAAQSEANPATIASISMRIRGTREELQPGPYDLYQSRLDGSEIRRLIDSAGFDAYPAIAPNGRIAVFSSARNSGQRDLYVMTVGDGSPRRLTSDAAREIDPAFSADGKRLAWVRLADDGLSSRIYVADGKWTAAKAVTDKTALQAGPAWHPNSSELVFTSNRADGKAFDIYQLDTKQKCLKRLTESPNDEVSPAFSPDGAKIAFASNHSGRYQIYIMDYRPSTSCLDEAP